MSNEIGATLVHSDPDILGGIPVFAGTRVPAQTLMDYLIGGHTLADFLDDFPTVSESQARGILEALKRDILERRYESAA